jgi:hypothetical protein
MTLHVPQLMQEASGGATINYSQQEWRQQIASILAIAMGAPGAQGIVGTGDFLVAQRAAGANFSVDIAAGTAYIVDDDVTSGGTYWVWSDAVYNLATPSPPGSGTEHHRVILQVRNQGENGAWSTYDFIPVLLADTGAGEPALPPTAMNLATVAIASGAASVVNADITDLRTQLLVSAAAPGLPAVGYQTGVSIGNQDIVSTSPIAITGLSADISVAGTYRIEGVIAYTCDVTNGNPTIRFEGPSASHVRMTGFFTNESGTGQTAFASNALDSDCSGPLMTVGYEYIITFTGVIVFTGTGTFSISGRTYPDNAHTWTALSYAAVDVIGPVGIL